MDPDPAPGGSAAAEHWLAARYHKLNHFINGSWVGPSSAAYIESASPVDQGLMVMVADGTAKDTDRAVAAARAAQPLWAARDGEERAEFLHKCARKIEQYSQLFSELENLGDGRLAAESGEFDMPGVVKIIDNLADQATQQEHRSADEGPAAVEGQIVRGRFTVQMIAGVVTPALAMGRSVVLKPSGFSSCLAVLLAQVCKEAGLPAGVFNLLLGDDKAGNCLQLDPGLTTSVINT